MLDQLTKEQLEELLVTPHAWAEDEARRLADIAGSEAGNVLLNRLSVEELDALIKAAQDVREEKKRWQRLMMPPTTGGS